MIEKDADAIFREAQTLYERGRDHDAALKLSELICGHGDPQVREKAAVLFAQYRGIAPLSAQEISVSPSHPLLPPSEPTRPSLQHHRAAPVPSDTSAAEKAFCEAMRRRRERRLADVSLPPRSSLPAPLSRHLQRFLQLSFGRTCKCPDTLVQVVETIEKAIHALPAESTQVDVRDMVQSHAAQFSHTDIGADVFNALVMTLYANGYLNEEHVQQIAGTLLPSGKKRTIRELMEGKE